MWETQEIFTEMKKIKKQSLQLIHEIITSTGHRLIPPKSIILLYISNEYVNIKILNILLVKPAKNMKYVLVSLTRHV